MSYKRIALGGVVSLNFAIASLSGEVLVSLKPAEGVGDCSVLAAELGSLSLSLKVPAGLRWQRGIGNPWLKTRRVEVLAAPGHLEER